jgi:Spy/CpxP family protein refolding chaperone
MKNLFNSKRVFVFLLFASLMIPVGVTAVACGPGGWHGKAMAGNCTGAGAAARMEKMKAMLDLSDGQKALMEEMHQANRALHTRMCPDATAGCGPEKEQIRTMHLFRAEIAAENPDFQAVAAKVKAEYKGEYRAEFDAAVDARATFMESLTPEQRDKLLKMRAHGRFHNKHHGRGRGHHQPDSADE